MRTSIDVLRSLKRYTAIALGEDWEVRLLQEEGTFSRPAAQVLQATGQQITGPHHAMDIVQTFSIHAFPEAGDTMESSLLAAAQAEELLVYAFRVGVDKGKAARVPLYDYDGVPFNEGSTTRKRPDYARIIDLEISRIQNPSDELLFTVTAEVRMGWRRNALLESEGEVATDVVITQDAT